MLGRYGTKNVIMHQIYKITYFNNTNRSIIDLEHDFEKIENITHLIRMKGKRK